MRSYRIFFWIPVFVLAPLAAASAAEIKVRIVDPQSAVVAGAQVALFAAGSSTPLAVQYSSPEGVVVFRDAGSGPYRLRVLAAGFASQSVDASSGGETTVNAIPDRRRVVRARFWFLVSSFWLGLGCGGCLQPCRRRGAWGLANGSRDTCPGLAAVSRGPRLRVVSGVPASG
jgi:hypothetical protein